MYRNHKTLWKLKIIYFKLIFRKARAKQQRGENYKALDAEDEVRLYEDGWKDRYFRSKFDVSADDTEFRRKVVEKYTEGLCWVLSYYYQGQVLADHKLLNGPSNRSDILSNHLKAFKIGLGIFHFITLLLHLILPTYLQLK